MDARSLGRHVKKVMLSQASYRLLDRHPEIAGGTWSAGGCSVLASALKKMYPYLVIVAIVDNRGQQHHHLVYDPNGDLFIDADGASTERQLLARWKRREMLNGPRIEWKPKPTSRIPCPRMAVDELVDLLVLDNPADHRVAARLARGG